MLSYIASSLIAASVIATHEWPLYSGVRLDFSEGGKNWEGNCLNTNTDQSQSPIDITSTTVAKEMKLRIEGMEHWGKAYAPKSPAEDDPRAAAEPDFSK